MFRDVLMRTNECREDTNRLVDHAYGLLMQDSGSAPTLLTYKPTATVEEVLGLASVLLEAHRVRTHLVRWPA